LQGCRWQLGFLIRKLWGKLGSACPARASRSCLSCRGTTAASALLPLARLSCFTAARDMLQQWEGRSVGTWETYFKGRAALMV